MCDEEKSSQMKSWLFTAELLSECREKANRIARVALAAPSSNGAADSVSTSSDVFAKEITGNNKDDKLRVPVKWFASGYAVRRPNGEKDEDEEDDMVVEVVDEWKSEGGHALLSPEEEQLLIQFYAGKLPSLIGPSATIPRLRRDVKVAATAALLFRRFFLSNSVMIHDPKAIMVAAAFLGSKVEDATVDIRYLEEATKIMQAPVTLSQIIAAEVHLAAGVNFELLCFHPYKPVLAYTEDLRTYLKSEKGHKLVMPPTRIVSGEDLRPIHDEARRIIDDVCVSDIPLLYTPGQIGLAAMIVAKDQLLDQPQNELNIPQIDLYGYIRQRFNSHSQKEHDILIEQLHQLCSMLKELRSGAYGCGNHGLNDIVRFKSVHKKLKKCRVWGADESENDNKKKKKKKKRKRDDDDAQNNAIVKHENE